MDRNELIISLTYAALAAAAACVAWLIADGLGVATVAWPVPLHFGR